ncbi:MAG TPA: hypothetical protein VNH11_26710 [Pirellulales bacterium]|nr:hypothetical protein [Pirellulales bacterium]
MPNGPSNPKQTRQKPLPQCKAVLLCENVVEDEITGQFSLNKLIDVVRFSTFPGVSLPFALFLQLYDGIGRYQLAIELRDLADGTRVAVAMFSSLDFIERLANMDVVLPVDSLRLPRAGRYQFAVLLDGEELATQHLDAEFENGEETE